MRGGEGLRVLVGRRDLRGDAPSGVPPADRAPAPDDSAGEPQHPPGPLRGRAGRRRGGGRLVRTALVLLVGLVLVVPLLPRLFAGPRAGVVVATGGSASAPVLGAGVDAAVARSVDALLQARASAVLSGDRAAWSATLDPTLPTLARDQDAVFSRLIALQVTRWRYRLIALSRAPAVTTSGGGGTALTARVELAYRLAGDTRDVLRDRAMTIDGRRGAVQVASESPDGRPDLWDLGPLSVARRGRALAVTLAGGAASAPQLAGLADAAARAVDTVWGTSWPRTVVVVYPADLGQLATLTDRQDLAGLAQLAAVTSGPLDRAGARSGSDAGSGRQRAVAGAADRVVLNPQVWPLLSDVGRRVVLTHEVTHVATRATTSATPPLWLDEGFAQYVGYRDTGLPARTVAADALAPVRAGRVPDALPTADAFDPSRGDTGPAYAQAWVACDLIAARAGVAGLALLYRVAASGDGGETQADAGLRAVLGEDRQAFTVQWRAALRTLAGAGG